LTVLEGAEDIRGYVGSLKEDRKHQSKE
jgi:hypothetical protein